MRNLSYPCFFLFYFLLGQLVFSLFSCGVYAQEGIQEKIQEKFQKQVQKKNATIHLKKTKGDYVVLFHGIGGSYLHMKKIEEDLEEEGYDVLNIDYLSREFSLEELADTLYEKIKKLRVEEKTIHFVGYSMGGLLVRVVLNKYKFKNLGRVVQIASPNKGSEVSDYFKDVWFYKKIFGPAGQQLVTNYTRVNRLLGMVYYELGIIAGTKTLDPYSSNLIPGLDDGKVSVKSTKVRRMKDHTLVHSSHLLIPYNEEARAQVLHFLQKGVFIKKINFEHSFYIP